MSGKGGRERRRPCEGWAAFDCRRVGEGRDPEVLMEETERLGLGVAHSVAAERELVRS